jgi:hypothetical protein
MIRRSEGPCQREPWPGCGARGVVPGPGGPGTGGVGPAVKWWGSVLGCGDGDLGATGAGVAGHQAVGEEAAAVGMVLARAGPPGHLLRAVRDGAVAVHDQLSETAPHPSPPHGSPPAVPAGDLLFPGSREGLWRCIGARRGLLEEFSQHIPNSLVRSAEVP